jgi:hypothetical protein
VSQSNAHISPTERSTRGELELFLDRSSAEAGGVVGVYASARSAVRASLWRLGARARCVAELGELAPQSQPPPVFVPETGLVHCSEWHRTTDVTIDPRAESGVYAVRLETVAEPSRAAEAIFVVLPRSEVDVLVVLPTTTWAAYNWWGGRSIYDGDGYTGLPRAHQVSFDRPMKPDAPPLWELAQGHPYYTWEHPIVAWIERQGWDVGFATSLELHAGQLVAGKLIVSAGHDEYWSREMRATVDAGLERGLSLFVAGANEICWNIRLDPSALGAARTLTCFKDPWSDPVIHSDPRGVTSRWADWPLHWPESDTTGVRFVDWDFALNRRPAAWIVRDSRHPLFDGTNFSDGDRVEGIVGDEWDAFDPSSEVAGSVRILGESEPLVGANLGPSVGHTVVRRTDAGGLVFATGTTSWCWGLDSSSVPDRATRADPRLQRLTRNVVEAALDGFDW